MIGHFLCLIGKHKWRYRKHGSAMERICMRTGCKASEKLQARKDDSRVRLFQGKRSPRMKKILA